MKKYLIFLALLILLTSCYSTKEVYNYPPREIHGYSAERINGIYVNKNTKDTISTNLWKTLYECKSLRKDATRIGENVLINLYFDGKNTLYVEAIEKNVVVEKFKIKCKIYREYLSIKRKLIIIPFPFIYFRISARKVLIGNNYEGNLIVKKGYDEFLNIAIMSGGQDWISCEVYEKK